MMNGSAFILYIEQYFMDLFQFRITMSTWSLYYCVEPAMYMIGNFAAALITNKVCLLFVIKQDSSRPLLY